MMHLLKAALALAIFTSLPMTSFGNQIKEPIPTVEHVDLDSYLGVWHEILRIKNSFQDNEPRPGEGACFNTTAEYSLLQNGKIGVKNSCTRKSGVEVAQAKARVVEGSSNSKLKVNFTGIPILECLGIGDGDYWIIALGEKNAEGLYSWVLVGSPKLDFGWVLSRNAKISDSDLTSALSAASAVGYDTKLFNSTQR